MSCICDCKYWKISGTRCNTSKSICPDFIYFPWYKETGNATRPSSDKRERKERGEMGELGGGSRRERRSRKRKDRGD